jgi:hypothetical protein
LPNGKQIFLFSECYILSIFHPFHSKKCAFSVKSNIFSIFATKQAVLSPFRFGGGEESPDNKGHCASERGDIREGMVTEKKITVPTCRDKGEKVG